jgi:hypothetical protein
MNKSFINRPPLYAMYQIITGQKERGAKEEGGRRRKDGEGGAKASKGGAIGRQQ